MKCGSLTGTASLICLNVTAPCSYEFISHHLAVRARDAVPVIDFDDFTSPVTP